jgi:hypothetical protein
VTRGRVLAGFPGGHGTQQAQRMIPWNSLLGTDIAEDIQLLLIYSAHAFFLSDCIVEAREFSGTVSGSMLISSKEAL